MIARLIALLLLLAPTAAGAQTWLSRVQTMACGGSQFARGLAVTGVMTCAQPAFSDLSGTISGAQMVAPGVTTLGGVKSSSASANQFAVGVDTTGAIVYAQPSFGNLSGSIAASQLIAPGASTFGGIKSSSAPANQFATGVNTSGVVTYAQPAFSNLSGTVAASQLPGVIATTTQSGTTYPLTQSDCGTSIRFTSASAVLVTLPATLTLQCVVMIWQGGAGNVSFTQAATSTTPANAHGYTKTFAQYSAVVVFNGIGGLASAWALQGDAQ